MAMKSSKRLTRLLPRDNYLCGTHVSGCGKPIRNKKDATVDHIFTKSFFKDREDGLEPKHYNKDWNLQPMHQECNNDRQVLSELRAFQARRQADSEARPGLGDQLRHQG